MVQQLENGTAAVVKLTGILTGLVIAQETADQHTRKAVSILINLYVEVTHQEVAEVIAGQLIEQLVLVYGIGHIGQHEDIAGLTLETQRVVQRGVAGEVVGTPHPDVGHVELAAMQLTSLLYATHNHTRQFRDLALRIVADHLLQPFDTALGIAFVQQRQTIYKEELRTVLAKREATFRQLGIGMDLRDAVFTEGIVGGGIERVFYMCTETLVLNEMGVSKQSGPRTLRVVGTQSGEYRVNLCTALLA